MAPPAHDGFMFRFTLGFGGASNSINAPGADTTLSGFTGFASLDIGGALAPGLLLHGRVGGLNTIDPLVTVNDEELGYADATIGFGFFGVGITFYLPINLYLTGAIGICAGSLDTGSVVYKFNSGLGIDLDVGYEWFIGGDWGMGVAGRLTLRTAASNDDDADPLVGLGAGVLWSVTYN